MKELIIIFICLFLSVSSQARIITVDDDVPADFNNVQAAINDANDGDTVVVADGIYTGEGNRDIDFLGKAITVRSENGPNNCVIDCNGSADDPHRGFYFRNEEAANSILEGVTIKHAYVDGDGGGILCLVEACPTITNCKLMLNQAGSGGGINLIISAPTISNCLIAENQAQRGGGIFVCSPLKIPVFRECEIRDNIAIGGEGGALWYGDSYIELQRCIFANNKSLGSQGLGGGIFAAYLDDYRSLIEDCEFFANQATTGGAGIALYGTARNMLIRNCTFWENSAEYGAGIGMYWATSVSPQIVNCTFHHNVASEFAGAIGGFGCWDSDSTKVSNCIVWDNEPNSDSGILVHRYSWKSCSQPWETVDFSILQSDWQGEKGLTVENCFIADPCFADADANDFHLKSQAGRWDPNSESWVIDDVTSPAIDAGNPADPIGYEPFPNGGIVNMGAYGGTDEASKSYFGTTPCETIVAGDINGDCKVNFVDIALLCRHWLEDNNP